MTTVKRIVAKGFKSFANKTELHFGNGFNCIIGPNGSGKSNVVDALCFVLGKSSAKEMRAERSASLIYNGGKKKNPAKEAEVSIVFDNSKKKFPVDEKELTVTRVVKKNGTSTYKINGNTLTRQQVLEVLRMAKVDPDGHNIVLQGDIVGFMELKPVERRKIIEEIAGISGFEEKKQKCLNELERVDGKLNEAEIILKEREANLRELKKERDQAKRWKELQDSIQDDKGTFLHMKIKDKNQKLEEVEKKKKEHEEKIQKSEQEIEALKEQINTWKEDVKKINQEIEEKGEKDQLILRREIESLKEELIKANSRVEVCESEVERLKTRKQQLSVNIKEIDEKVRSLQQQKKDFTSQLQSQKQREAVLDEKIAKFKEKHGIESNLNDALEVLEKGIEENITSFNALNQKKQDLIREKTELEIKLKNLTEKIAGLKGQKSSKEFEDLKDKKKFYKEISTRLSKALNEDSSFASQLARSRQTLADASQELAKLQGRQISFMERSTADLAVKRILDMKSKMKGIYGTVSQLGQVPAEYALSLEVAAGARVQSVVVDNDLTAQKCIQYLKNNKLGIATFLPLNKIKARVMDPSLAKLAKDPAVKGFAIDLIKFDPKFKNVFSYVLGSTLVVNDITSARRIGVGRARMVTLQGDIIEPSGAMIGGFRSAKRKFSFKESNLDEDISSLEAEISKYQSLINHVQEKRNENDNLISSLREQRATLEGEVIKLEKSLSLEGVDMDALMEEKRKLTESSKSLDAQFSDIESQERSFQKAIAELKQKKSKLKEKIASPDLAKNLESLEDQRMKVIESTSKLESSVSSLDMQINSLLLPESEKTQKIIKQHDDEQEKFSSELSSLQEMIKKRKVDLKQKEVQESKFHTNLKGLVQQRNKVGEKIQAKESSIAREEERVKGVQMRLNNISIDRAKFVAELEGLQEEFKQFEGCKIKRGLSIEQLQLRVREAEKEMTKIGNVNLRALDVYEEIHVEHQKLVDKITKLKDEKDDVLSMVHEVEEKKKGAFMKTYNVIVKNFKTIFSSLTTKGEAHVVLEDPENIFEGGVDIQVKLVGNKFLDVRSLSGGEKTMAALSFIFAIQEFEPSPFYLLDEVDAALDKKNSETLSRLVRQYASNAQYIVISHNDALISDADIIYGVSMQEGVSKVVSLKV